jgi:translation initiation factor IF-3
MTAVWIFWGVSRPFSFSLFSLQEGFFIAKQELPINNQIREREVRLIGSDGAQLGIVSGRDAQNMADEKELDLVMISPAAVPPVCKIMDYGKFVFEKNKRDKEAKKNQKIVETKEIRMFSTIDTNDFNTKVSHACSFLKNGDKVKVQVRFRKRAIAHPHLGEELLISFRDACAEYGTFDGKPVMEGRQMMILLTPKKSGGSGATSGKAEGGKAEGGKVEGSKAEGGKAEGGKVEGGKAEGGKAEGGVKAE